jgi:hypothetical protein
LLSDRKTLACTTLHPFSSNSSTIIARAIVDNLARQTVQQKWIPRA